MNTVLIIIEILGVAFVAGGLYFIYPPLALIVIGLFMIAVANIRKP